MTPAEVLLVRHGETAWTISRQHTSHTDVPLTERGSERAAVVGQRLAGRRFALVLTSPRRRAVETCRAAGYPDATVDEDLVEWDYGDYEGITTLQIRETVPGWSVWTHPTPGGETAEQVATRLDRVVKRLRQLDGRALVFGHGHALRVLAARWIGRPPEDGRFFRLDTSTVSVLGFERDTPVLLRWNS
jgi:broad specificity phosphatase PhoE